LPRILNGVLPLHDVRDTEQLCWAVVARSRLNLPQDQRESLCSYLIETAWELSLRYEPGRRSTNNFAGWATVQLRLRVIDWIRKEYGRTKWHSKGQAYERKNPEFLSFDADSSDRNQLDAAIGTWDGNLEASWDPTLERLDAGRSSARSGDLRTLGIRTRRRVTH
jgi:hypothetical protein